MTHPLAATSFRGSGTFPTFAELPDENDIDPAFYGTVDGFTYTPRKHWCFLAEIVAVENFIRVKLLVRDRSGSRVPVTFYTDGRGSEFAPQLQQGHTIAIMYALQHGFLDMSVGIRLEECSGVKIIPVSLDELLGLSDRVQQYSAEQKEQTCHGCDKKKTELQKCGRCSMFRYCNKACQTTGWVARGHKRDCKIIRENGLRAIFLLDWNDFQQFAKFPLPEPTTKPRTEGTTTTVQMPKHTAGHTTGVDHTAETIGKCSLSDAGPSSGTADPCDNTAIDGTEEAAETADWESGG